ncbi:hypothetical protein BV898_06989 [Hypsibius exemplaris]|uniref:Uncharacterized protein n=1 Tax=Hypsibius exemplaris TaxID=2072580 RepID=A0A1W0WUN8_HYPEX|nr:hypothetical protein BV898_06989 [Hypsibius exemplaris]
MFASEVNTWTENTVVDRRRSAVTASLALTHTLPKTRGKRKIRITTASKRVRRLINRTLAGTNTVAASATICIYFPLSIIGPENNWACLRLLGVAPPSGRDSAFWARLRLLGVTSPSGRDFTFWAWLRLLGVAPPSGVTPPLLTSPQLIQFDSAWWLWLQDPGDLRFDRQPHCEPRFFDHHTHISRKSRAKDETIQ